MYFPLFIASCDVTDRRVEITWSSLPREGVLSKVTQPLSVSRDEKWPGSPSTVSNSPAGEMSPEYLKTSQKWVMIGR